MILYLPQGCILLIDKRKFSGQVLSNKFVGCTFLILENKDHLLLAHIDEFSSLQTLLDVMSKVKWGENPRAEIVSSDIFKDSPNVNSLMILFADKAIAVKRHNSKFIPFHIIVDILSAKVSSYNIIDGESQLKIPQELENKERERLKLCNLKTQICSGIDKIYIDLMNREDRQFFLKYLKDNQDEAKQSYTEILSFYRTGEHLTTSHIKILSGQNKDRGRFAQLLFNYQIKDQELIELEIIDGGKAFHIIEPEHKEKKKRVSKCQSLIDYVSSFCNQGKNR